MRLGGLEPVAAMPDSKRHHFIPQFILRNFSVHSAAKNPTVWRLDKVSGRIHENGINNEAVIGHFNRLEAGDAPNVEKDFAAIESVCKPAFDKVIAREGLTETDAELISLFSVLQERRTPRARQQTTELMEHGMRVIAELEAAKGTGVRDMVQSQLGREPTDDEVKAAQDELVADLSAGRVVLQASPDHEILSPFVAADNIAKEVMSKMRLTCLHAVGAEFVLSDHPVCMVDPIVPRDRGIGWMSTPYTQVTFPISRSVCLIFRPGPPGFAHVDAKADLVSDINMRSYAFAQGSIYGSSQRWVQDCRTAAKRNRSKVLKYEPHKRHLIFFESLDGAEPHGVQIAEPTEKTERAFRRQDRPVRRPPRTEPITKRQLREWSLMKPHAMPYEDSDAD